MIELIQKNWWLVALRGIIAILFGLSALFAPLIVIFSLLTFFAFFLVFSGFVIITLAFLGEYENKWLRLFEGFIFILTGAVVILNPEFAVGGVMLFIASWAILTGVINIVNAVSLRKVISNEWFMIFNGVISILFGFLLATNLLSGALAVTSLFGIFALLHGLFILIVAFRIKGLK